MKHAMILLLVAATRTAFADDAPPPDLAHEMSRAGHVAIDGELAASFAYDTVSPPMGSSRSGTGVRVAPTVDYFVADGLSVGATVDLRHASTDSATATLTDIGIGPRVGYHIALAPRLGIWLRAGVIYAHSKLSIDAGGSSTATLWTALVSAPLVFHPVEHFYIGFGPALQYDLSARAGSSGGMDADADRSTVLGFTSTIGGWF